MPGAKNPNSFVIKWERSIKHSLEKCKLVFRRAVAKGKKCNNFVLTKRWNHGCINNCYRKF